MIVVFNVSVTDIVLVALSAISAVGSIGSFILDYRNRNKK